jgi:hypothetical protein
MGEPGLVAKMPQRLHFCRRLGPLSGSLLQFFFRRPDLLLSVDKQLMETIEVAATRDLRMRRNAFIRSQALQRDVLCHKLVDPQYLLLGLFKPELGLTLFDLCLPFPLLLVPQHAVKSKLKSPHRITS